MENTLQRPIIHTADDLRDYMINLLKDQKRAISFFVGAGISVPEPSSIPSASVIIRKTINSLCLEKGMETYRENLPNKALESGLKMEVLFEIIHQNIGNRLKPLLALFQGKEPNYYHYFLTKLLLNDCINCIVTTNFDTLIETSSPIQLNIYSTEEEHANRNNQSIYKIHGTIDRPETIITLLPQVTKGLGFHKHQLLQDVLANPCVIIGWSDADIDLTPSFIQAKHGNLIWFSYGPQTNQIIDYSATTDVDCDEKDLQRIHQILKKNDAILAKCDPLSFILSLWNKISEDIGDIPELVSEIQRDKTSIVDDWSKSLSTIERKSIVGDILRQLSIFDDALNMYQNIESDVTDPTILFNIHYRMGLCATHLASWNLAFKYYNRALGDKKYLPSIEALLNNRPRNPEIAFLYGNIGLLLREIGRYHDAAICYALDAELSETYRLPGVSHAYSNYARILSMLGDIEHAIVIADKGIQNGIHEGNIHAITEGHAVLAELAVMRGDWDTANIHLEKTRYLNEIAGRPDLFVTDLQNLANFACNRGNFEYAEKYAKRSCDISSSLRIIDLEAASWMVLANVYKERGIHKRLVLDETSDNDFNQAISAYQRSLELIGNSKSIQRLKSIILTNFGQLYYIMKNIPMAYSLMSESLTIRTHIKDQVGRAPILDNLALIMLSMGMIDEAEESLSESMDIYQNFNHKYGQCQIFNDLGCVYKVRLLFNLEKELKNSDENSLFYDKSENYFQKSLEMATNLEMPVKIKVAEKNLADLHALRSYI
jgi:tetratricopeptide (TPR) repeat protein